MDNKYTQFTEALMELPVKIKDLQLSILDKTAEQTHLTNEIAKLEAKIKTEINAAVDAAGKKLFTNAEMRAAELVERVEADLEISSIKQQHEDLSNNISISKIDLECLNNIQRNTRLLLEFFSNINK
jgi:hypothetical protein